MSTHSNRGRNKDASGRFVSTNGTNGAAAAAAPAAARPPGFGPMGQAPRPVGASAPLPPLAQAPAPAVAASAPAAAPPQPPPQAPAAAPHVEEPPPAAPIQADAKIANNYRARVQQHDNRVYGAASRPFPASEVNLPQVWLEALRTRGFPPQALTINVRSVRPEPPYDFWIDGGTVCGEHPDREIHEYIERMRRRPEEAELFSGRVVAIDMNGAPMDLGWGNLYLAPRVAAPAGTWAQPQPPGWRPPGPPGPPPGYPPPYGAPPPYGPYGAPPGYGAPWGPAGPYFAPYGQPPPYGYPYPPPPAPAAAPPPTSDPVALEFYRTSQQQAFEAQQNHLRFLERIATERAGMSAGARAVDPDVAEDRAIARMERYAGLMEKLRGPPAEPAGSPVHVTTLPSGDTIVSGKDGVDKDMTGLFMAKGIAGDVAKRFGDAWAKRKVVDATQGAAGSLASASVGRSPRPV